MDTMADWAHKIRPEISLTRFAPCGGSKVRTNKTKTLRHFSPLKFSGSQLVGKVCKEKNEGVHFGRRNILHFPTRHDFLRALLPLKNVLPPFSPPGEKKLATPLITFQISFRVSEKLFGFVMTPRLNKPILSRQFRCRKIVQKT